VAPLGNTALFIVDGSPSGLRCSTPPAGSNSCFFGVSRSFQQICSPACYWGGLCDSGRCVKQRNSCLIFCPAGFACSYGHCVRAELIPLFLQQLVPHLYTDKALVQPDDPDAPLFIGDGTSNAQPPSSNGDDGGGEMIVPSAAQPTTTAPSVAALTLAAMGAAVVLLAAH